MFKLLQDLRRLVRLLGPHLPEADRQRAELSAQIQCTVQRHILGHEEQSSTGREVSAELLAEGDDAGEDAEEGRCWREEGQSHGEGGTGHSAGGG